ncbi:MAG TPA: ATPase [Clostridiales bacterium UBA8153]|nr:ATPase [Clostridiales bacterium UBA8153]
MQHLGTSETGLTHAEAAHHLQLFGPNRLAEETRTPVWRLLMEQFKSFLIIILVVASVISLAIGKTTESLAIIVIVVIAGVLGFAQEYRAEQALAALNRLAALQARVVREGAEHDVPVEELVPGDLILLVAGNKVPADARLVQAFDLRIEEAVLTGESAPVDKVEDLPPGDDDLPIGDQKNMVFMGTIVTYGRARAVVTSTGMDTEFGRIAGMLSSVQQDKTPLQHSVDGTARSLGLVALFLAGFVGVLAVWRGHPLVEVFTWSTALAVAMVPEALPAVITVTLALGAHRLAQRHALVRRLQAVETLGSTSVICTDKTGTLTEDRMTVKSIWISSGRLEVEGAGLEPEGGFLLNGERVPVSPETGLLLTAGALCNDGVYHRTGDSWTASGDATDIALLVLAAKGGMDARDLATGQPRTDEIPFSSERKRMTTIHRTPDGLTAYSKGAVEVILASSAFMHRRGADIPLEPAERTAILETADAMAEAAMRVLGISYKPLGNSAGSAEEGMVFVGMVGMIDPPRRGVKEAIASCRAAGIQVVMITGDHRRTATAIADQLGLSGGRVVTGPELDAMDQTALVSECATIGVYARVSPTHKLRIVQALQQRNRIVAMTGDGVNDAPALKQADIGIAMGITGTDASKEVSDMVLTDDNFVSMVAAVKEGRTIFANIRRFLTYLLSDNAGAVMAYLAAILAGYPMPITPLQILFINLIMDGPNAISLGLEPHEPGTMDRPPRPPRAPIIDGTSLRYIFTVGPLLAAVTLGIFVLALPRGEQYAVTVFFTSMIAARLFNAFNCRSAVYPLLKLGPWANRWLLLSFAGSLALLMPIIYLPALQPVFSVVPLRPADWLWPLAAGLTVLFTVEVLKYAGLARKNGPGRPTT